MNETMIAKEEQQIKADILTLEKMSKYEENVRNLTSDLSNDRMEHSRSSNETLSSIRCQFHRHCVHAVFTPKDSEIAKRQSS